MRISQAQTFTPEKPIYMYIRVYTIPFVYVQDVLKGACSILHQRYTNSVCGNLSETEEKGAIVAQAPGIGVGRE